MSPYGWEDTNLLKRIQEREGLAFHEVIWVLEHCSVPDIPSSSVVWVVNGVIVMSASASAVEPCSQRERSSWWDGPLARAVERLDEPEAMIAERSIAAIVRHDVLGHPE